MKNEKHHRIAERLTQGAMQQNCSPRQAVYAAVLLALEEADKPAPPRSSEPRQPPRIGDYPEAAMRLLNDYATGKRWLPSFNVRFSEGITADQAREAAHLLNQLAEYLGNESNG